VDLREGEGLNNEGNYITREYRKMRNDNRIFSRKA
jgi:hypothetical protein